MIAHPPTSRIRPHPFLPIAAALLGVFGSSQANAAPFLYAPGDLLVTFRQPGSAGDLVVNLGRVTQFTAVAPDQSVPLPAVTASALTAAFPSLSGLRWSVAAANRPPGDPGFPLQTIWVSAPRLDPATPAPAWLRKGQFVQGNAASQIEAIGANSTLVSSLLPGGPANTATLVVVPGSASYPLGPVLGDGNYVGTFQGNVESLTPDDFADAPERRSRADLYELQPGTTAAGTLNAPGRHLGFFELSPAGALTFNTITAALPSPRITRIARQGEATTVTFETVAGANYRLRYTGPAGLVSPISTWNTSGSGAGTGSPLTLQDTTSDGVRFYAVEALR